MCNWAFFDAHGTELTRGWQGTRAQARQLAQQFANRTMGAVEFLPATEGYAIGELVQPAIEVREAP